MGVLAIFSTIGFVGCILGAIFSKKYAKECLIIAGTLALVATAGFLMEHYSGTHPKVTVEEYKTFSIDLYRTTIKFENPVLIKKTETKYTLASAFHEGYVVYEVTPLSGE